MIKTAYIERNGNLHYDEKKLVQELNKRNIPIVYFSKKQIDRNKITIENPYLISADIKTTMKIFSLLDIPKPISNSYPIELSNFYNREIFESTLGEAVIRYKRGEIFFLKPRYDFKSFIGFIVSDHLGEIEKFTRKFKSNYPIYTSSIITINSEYRAYVMDNSLLEISHYFGKEEKLDVIVVEKAIKELSKNKNTPTGYAIDFGVTNEGKTVVIEMNEGFSIDSYNCSSENYFKVIRARFQELLSKS